jgi:hypothetical protein
LLRRRANQELLQVFGKNPTTHRNTRFRVKNEVILRVDTKELVVSILWSQVTPAAKISSRPMRPNQSRFQRLPKYGNRLFVVRVVTIFYALFPPRVAKDVQAYNVKRLTRTDKVFNVEQWRFWHLLSS